MLVCRFVAALSVLSFVTITGADEPVDDSSPETYALRFKFEPGQKLRYESVQRLTQQGVVGQGQKLTATKTKQRRVFTVQDVTDDGEAKVSMQFEHVRMEAKVDSLPTEVFDSKMEADKVPKRFQGAARNLMAAAPVYTLKSEGTPVSAEGVEVIPEGGQASFMIPLPEEAIAVGDTWKVNMRASIRIAEGVKREITLLRSFRLKSVKDGIADIGFSTSIMSTGIRSPALKAQLLQATPQGDIKFDVTNGRLLSKEFRIDKMVMGALGANTMLSAKGRTVETLLVEDAKVTSR